MDEPGYLTLTARGFLFFLIAFALPQAGGVLSLRWAWRARNRILLIPALLVAAVIFFATAYVFWGMQAKSIEAEGHYVCGTFAAAAFLSTFWGTMLHLALSGGVLFLMWLAAKRRARSPE